MLVQVLCLILCLPVYPMQVLTRQGSRSLRVVTWNILAPQFAARFKYPQSTPKDLDWSNREAKIQEILLESRADIICLQEVQKDKWESLIKPFSEDYNAVLQNVKGMHPVALGVLAKRSLPIRATESRSRALIVDFDDMFLVNVHLEAGARGDETRFRQIQSLLKRLQHRVEHSKLRRESYNLTLFSNISRKIEENTTCSFPPIVLAGDFNMLQNHKLLQSLQGNGEKVFNDHEFLPLQSVFQRNDLNLTFASGSVLDYILCSPSLKVNAKWTLPNVDTNKYSWPSDDLPSDHMPIGADIGMRQCLMCDIQFARGKYLSMF